VKRRAKKALGIGSALIGGSVIAAGAVSHAVTKYLVKIALDRDLPEKFRKSDRTKQQLTGSPKMQDFLSTIAEGAKKLEESGCETVEIISHDGERLVGHWHTCKNAKRTIIAMHGWRSCWAKDFGTIADFWHNSGCNVLYVEQRGQNNSGGDYMGFGLLERYDCVDWINWVNERYKEKLPVYLGGVSMGATTVMMAAGLNLPGNVCGIMADCGFTSAHAIWKHVVEDNLHMNYDMRAAAVDDLCKKKIQIGANEYATTEALRECEIPVLFIHGTDDAFVPVEMTYENYKACVAPRMLLIVPGAGHGMSYYTDRKAYEAASEEFWHKYDSGSSGRYMNE